MTLRELGWNDRLSEAFEPYARDGLAAARVSLEHTHIYRVIGEGGELLARVSGRLRHHAATRAEFPAVGDWVVFDTAADDGDRSHPGGAARDRAASRAARPGIARRNRSSPRTSTSCSSSAGSTATSIRAASSATCSSPGRAVRRPWSSSTRRTSSRDPGEHVDAVRSIAPGVDVHAVTCTEPATLLALRAYLGAGRTGALLGIVRRGQVHNRQQAGGLRPACDAGRSRRRQPGSPHEHQPSAGPAAGARHPDRHAGHARAAVVGNRRCRRRHLRGHLDARRTVPLPRLPASQRAWLRSGRGRAGG